MLHKIITGFIPLSAAFIATKGILFFWLELLKTTTSPMLEMRKVNFQT